jgi:hypothetical protein
MVSGKLLRRCLTVLSRIALGTMIGLTVGALFWVRDLSLNGYSIADGLSGNVEDALGVLQGLLTLGGLIGFTVGLLHGLAVLLIRFTVTLANRLAGTPLPPKPLS